MSSTARFTLGLVGFAMVSTLHAATPTTVTFTGEPAAAIASGVIVPAGHATFSTSGIVPSLIKVDGATAAERYGDTYIQGLSCLQNLQKALAAQGLKLSDVVLLRAYLVADPAKSAKPDFPAWFRAYGEYFNNVKNPAKTARATLGVSALANPDLLVEIEAVAVFPESK